MLDKVTPRDKAKVQRKARKYVWSTALLYAITKIKCDFISAGFDVVHEDKKVEKYYKDLYKKIGMKKFVKNWSFEYLVPGEVVPFTNWKNNEPNYITILNPELVEIKNVFGKDFIYLKPDIDVEQLLSSENPEIEKELRKIIPIKILEEWKKGKSAYISDVKRYTNMKAYHEKYAHSPIEPIFADLEILHTLQEADFATARKLKQLFLHVKVGNEKFNNGKAVDKKLIEATEKLFTDPYKTAELVSQWFIDADYVIPDLSIFGNEKYESVITRILWWSGIQILFNNGGSYSEGTIKLKPFKQEVENVRGEIKDFLDEFNTEIAKRQGLTYYKDLKVPRVKFSKTALDDQKTVNEMLRFLYSNGVLSMEELHDQTGYDFKIQMKQKKDENEKYRDTGIVEPLFEPSQGLLDDKEGGDNEVNNQNDNQPRPN